MRYYASSQAPNGTHDLIIVNADSEVVGCVPEALFGLPDRLFRDSLGGACVCDGESVWYVPDAADAYDPVAELAHPVGTLARYVAVSPTQSIGTVLDALATIAGDDHD